MDKSIIHGFHYYGAMANAYKRICEKIEEMQEKGIVTFSEIAHLKKKYISLYTEYNARKEWFYEILTATGITVTEENLMSEETYNKEEKDVLRMVSFIKGRAKR